MDANEHRDDPEKERHALASYQVKSIKYEPSAPAELEPMKLFQ
jgi:hypothetical protein